MSEVLYKYVLRRYEEKLSALLSEEEFDSFMEEVAREGFKREIEGMKESPFKDFCLENFDVITK